MSEVACQDLVKIKIDNEILRRKKILLDNFKELKKTKEENEFYNMILNDYTAYYDFIKSEKHKQINQLEEIADYLENLKLTSSNLEDKTLTIKSDQLEILNKIKTIKEELDSITS